MADPRTPNFRQIGMSLLIVFLMAASSSARGQEHRKIDSTNGNRMSSLLLKKTKTSLDAERSFSALSTRLGNLRVLLLNTHHGEWADEALVSEWGNFHDGLLQLWGASHQNEHFLFREDKLSSNGLNYSFEKARLGDGVNAETARTYVSFFSTFPASSFDELTAFMGGMHGEDLSPEMHRRENPVVIDEIRDFLSRDDEVITYGIHRYLLNPTHPLSHYSDGEPQELADRSFEDLERHFDWAYRSPILLVSGNFDQALDPERVLQQLRSKYSKLIERTNAREIQYPEKFPPLVTSSTENRLVEFGTESRRFVLNLEFQIPDEIAENPAALQLLLDYLESENDGSLSGALVKRGWITEVKSDFFRTPGMNIVAFQFELTFRGAKKRMLIPKVLFEFLNHIGDRGLLSSGTRQRQGQDSRVLREFKDRKLADLEEMQPDEARNLGIQFLNSPQADSARFDFAQIYESVTDNEIRRIAQTAFSVDRMLILYLGHDVISDQVDPTFHRPYVLKKASEDFEFYRKSKKKILSEPEFRLNIGEIPLAYSTSQIGGVSQPVLYNKIQSDPYENNTSVVLQEDHSSLDGAIRIDIEFPNLSLNQKAALHLFKEAFEQAYRNQIGHLTGMKILDGIWVRGNTLRFRFQRNSGAAKTAALWIIGLFRNFVPQESELQLAREKIKIDYASSKDEFPAKLARKYGEVLLDPSENTKKEILPFVKSLSVMDLIQTCEGVFDSADIRMAMQGNFTKTDAEELADTLHLYFPKSPASDHRGIALENRVAAGLKMRASKEEALGRARFFAVPQEGTEDSAVMKIWMAVLDPAIFHLNRIERQLGYIQGADYQQSQSGNWAYLLGQTEGEQNLVKLTEAWEEILEKIRSKTFSHQEIEAAREGLLRIRKAGPKTREEVVNRLYHEAFVAKSLGLTDQETKLIESMSVDQILECGAKLFSAETPYLDVIAYSSKPKCVGRLVTLEEARKILQGR